MIRVRVYNAAIPQMAVFIDFSTQPNGALRLESESALVSTEKSQRIAAALALGQHKGDVDGFTWAVEEQYGPSL